MNFPVFLTEQLDTVKREQPWSSGSVLDSVASDWYCSGASFTKSSSHYPNLFPARFSLHSAKKFPPSLLTLSTAVQPKHHFPLPNYKPGFFAECISTDLKIKLTCYTNTVTQYVRPLHITSRAWERNERDKGRDSECVAVYVLVRVKDVLIYDIQIRTHLNCEVASSVFVVRILDAVFFCFAFIEEKRAKGTAQKNSASI